MYTEIQNFDVIVEKVDIRQLSGVPGRAENHVLQKNQTYEKFGDTRGSGIVILSRKSETFGSFGCMCLVWADHSLSYSCYIRNHATVTLVSIQFSTFVVISMPRFVALLMPAFVVILISRFAVILLPTFVVIKKTAFEILSKARQVE